MALTPFQVDGKSVQIDSDPQMPLLYALRDDLKLNNPKFGCGLALSLIHI
jgi:aerobic-type carbon monoxide dehydrogenase small subunit (CoxS/CutS family)